jgi:ABC-type amino acid transport substrate-binding protein/cytochrome c5
MPHEAFCAIATGEAGKSKRLLSALASALLVASLPAAALAVPADAAVGGESLNLCADPSNLPFSAQSSDSPGLYNELGQEIAGALGRPLNTVWSQSYFGKHTIRETLLAGKCDAYIGLPDSKDFMGPKLIFSKPFLSIGYALVLAKGSQAASLADLKGKRVAVQFATSPEILLADHDDIQAVTFLDPESAMKALAASKADAAIIWGPSAGYLNKTLYHDAYAVQPVSGKGMQWPVSVGFARSHGDLRDKVDLIIDSSADRIAALAAKYGFPQAEPVSLTDPTKASQSAADPKVILAATDLPPRDAQTPPSPGPDAAAPAPAAAETPAAAAGDPATIAAGREIFNGTCSHCHGPDAVIGQRKIDLRLLHQRYADKMDEVYHTTVTHGRPDKGMPNWTGVFTEEEFSKILAFLHSIQTPAQN